MSARNLRRALCVLALGLLLPATSSAQLPNASAAALGLGENVTATARGFSALSWNPAGLAMPGTRSFSISVLPIHGIAGMGPIGLGDFAEYQDEVLSHQVKSDWLSRIRSAGSQQGSAGVDATLVAVNLGRVGIQFSSMARASMDMSPEAAEVILFGNVGEAGQLGDFDLSGSAMEMAVLSTLALAYGHPFRLELGPLPAQHFAAGVTLKYTVGHALISGVDLGSRLQVDPLEVELNFPIIHPDTANYRGDIGRGLSIDVGAAWQGGPFSGAVVIRNLVNGFSWDLDRLAYTPFEAVLDSSEAAESPDFDMLPLSEAPAHLRARVEDLGFARTLALGGAFRATPIVTLTADIRREIGEALRVGPRTHVGVGAELRPLPVLPIRAGLTLISGGYQLSGGLGVEAGPMTLNGAVARRSGELGTDHRFMVTLGFGAR